MKFYCLLIVIFCGGLINRSAAQCPTVIFDVDGNFNYDCHEDGHLLLDLKVCEASVTEPYVLDSVVWKTGVDNIVTPELHLDYTYTENNNYHVVATAYFQVGGIPCSTVAVSNLTIMDDEFGQYVPATCDNPGSVGNILVKVVLLNPIFYATSAITDQDVPVDFMLAYTGFDSGYDYEFRVDGTLFTSSVLTPSIVSIYSGNFTPGQHVAELTLVSGKACSISRSILFEVTPTPEDDCEECFTFRPIPGKRYWLSAWVKEANDTQVLSYENTGVRLTFTGSGQPGAVLTPTGDIIEGWQRIAAEFTVPSGTTSISIQLENTSDELDAYFDDIRIHPFNASMKSYVYDPETFWLTAELDDNNYATFYEYDREGQLIRIKKETETGIVTIKESRSGNPKKQ